MGTGHIVRCLTLARALEAEGWQCALACRPGSTEQTQISPDIDILSFQENEDEPAALRRRWADGVDLLVVDHYGLNAVFEEACGGWAMEILVFDDLANRSHASDILVDQTYNREEADYAKFVSPQCRLMLGPQYAPLRSPLWKARKTALARRGGPLRRIMVAVGASDPSNFTAVALDAITQSGLDVEIDVVLGGGAPFVAAVREQCRKHPLTARLHVDVSATVLAGLITQADIAIGSGGISVWERCCLGLPSLLVIAAENQRIIIEGLNDCDAAEGLGDIATVDAAVLCGALRQIAGDDRRRHDMSDNAAEICDGRGLQRVLDEINRA